MYRSPSPPAAPPKNTLKTDPTAAARSSIRRPRDRHIPRGSAPPDYYHLQNPRRPSPTHDRLELLEIARRERARRAQPPASPFTATVTPPAAPTSAERSSSRLDDDENFLAGILAEAAHADAGNRPAERTATPPPAPRYTPSTLRYEYDAASSPLRAPSPTPRFAPAFRHELEAEQVPPWRGPTPGASPPPPPPPGLGPDDAAHALARSRFQSDRERLQQQREELQRLHDHVRRLGARVDRALDRPPARDSDVSQPAMRRHRDRDRSLSPVRAPRETRERSPGAPRRSRDAIVDDTLRVEWTRPEHAPDRPRVDGLGDRRRSPSPDDDTAWDTLLATIAPDARQPTASASTSFGSTQSASESAAESLGRALTRSTSATSRARAGRGSRTTSGRGSAASTAITAPSPPPPPAEASDRDCEPERTPSPAPPGSLDRLAAAGDRLEAAGTRLNQGLEQLIRVRELARNPFRAPDADADPARPAEPTVAAADDGRASDARHRDDDALSDRMIRDSVRAPAGGPPSFEARPGESFPAAARRAALEAATAAERASATPRLGSPEINQMRAIVERLERQERVPEEWWAAAGLARGFAEGEGRVERL